jgi:hypothetical protein
MLKRIAHGSRVLTLMFLCLLSVQAEEMTANQAPFLQNSSTVLQTAEQSALARYLQRKTATGVVILSRGTRVEILGHSSFTRKVDVQSQRILRVTREFVAYRVKVLDGPHARKVGWALKSYHDPYKKGTFLSSGSSRPPSVKKGPDLQLTLGTPTAKSSSASRRYKVYVANRGTEPTRGSIELSVKVGGKTLRNQHTMARLEPGQTHVFDIAVQANDVTQRHILELVVDAKNHVHETNELNNTLRKSLSPDDAVVDSQWF